MTTCSKCGQPNPNPKYKWCPACRDKGKGYSHGTHIAYEDLASTGVRYPRDLPFSGFKVKPGHAPGWWEIQ